MGYTVDADGFVILDDGTLLTYGEQDRQALYDKVLVPWGESIARHSERTGVPWSWIAAQIYIESRGNPTILGHDPGGTTGYGLMQLTHPSVFQGHDPQETLDDPDLNIALGTDVLAKNLHTMHAPADIVREASMFNCGPSGGDAKPRPITEANPWGYCQNEQSKHITKAVMANNTALQLGLPGGVPGTAGGFPWVAFTGLMVGAGLAALWIVKGGRFA